MNWYLEVLKKYAVFSGRAHRREYWLFVFINFIIMFVLGFIDVATGFTGSLGEYGLLSGLYALAVIIPNIAVAVRRLHDTVHSGWWLFITLIPFIGPIVLPLFLVQDNQQGPNRYGPNPKETATLRA